jgi:hypothetical protein
MTSRPGESKSNKGLVCLCLSLPYGKDERPLTSLLDSVTFEALSEAKLPTLNCTVADAGTEDEATLCTWPDRWKSQDLPMPFVSFRAY